MDWSSWFRRSLSRANANKDTQTPNQPKPSNPRKQGTSAAEDDEKLLGVTDQLIDHVKSFTLDTFKNFPLQEEEDRVTTAGPANVRNDLSEWQERHATAVLSKVKELSHLRFMLCPRHLKEQQFWRIYFLLVKSHVSEYELRAVQLAKLRRMAMENGESPETSVIEVEMSETKMAPTVGPQTL